MVRPGFTQKGNSTYYSYYKIDEVDKYLEDLKNSCFKGDITGKTLYLHTKTISQSKLREKGFKITRFKDKADYIIINPEIERLYKNDKEYYFPHYNLPEAFFDEIDVFSKLNCKFVLDSDLYKYLYKYDGDLALFENISQLFKSGNTDNYKIAMEFMTNADWSINKVYLMEIFQNFRGEMNQSYYKNSISFKGLLSSLDFNYGYPSLHQPSDYKEHCINQEHHDWVYNKYKATFDAELNGLFERYKIKLDKIEYSIDMEKVYTNKE